MTDYLDVAVAVIIDDQQRVCISQRADHVHQGGLWEFPGGKVEAGESASEALRREIHEELGLAILNQRPLITIRHHYPDKSVCLHVFLVKSYEGIATGRENQPVEWVPVDQLHKFPFPEANSPIIKTVQLPDRYMITGKFNNADDFIRRLKTALNNGIRLVQLRIKQDDIDRPDTLMKILLASSGLCRQVNAKLLLNIADSYLTIVEASDIEYHGIHADSRLLSRLTKRPDCELFSASCHDCSQLEHAQALGADFAVLSPVKPTRSHPDTMPLGWTVFSDLIKNFQMPVYALGGVGEYDLEDAWSHGAQGVAAISAFWPEKLI